MEPIIDSADSWLLVPVPPELKEPAHSFDSYKVPLYSPEMVATAILSAPGMRIVRPTRSWEDWQGRWEESGRFIEIEINGVQTVWLRAWHDHAASGSCVGILLRI